MDVQSNQRILDPMSSQKNRSKVTISAHRGGPLNQNKKKNKNTSQNSEPWTQGVAASYSSLIKTMSPQIKKTNVGMRIRHRELVLPSVAGSTTFTVQSTLRMNPGLAATFPWLAPQAIQWEQYICHSLRAEWVPIAPTSTAGDVILSPEYNSDASIPTSETIAGNAVDSITTSCWRTFCLDFDPKAQMSLGPRKFVRDSNVGGDINNYDCGILFTCTNNETGTTAIGKLYLEYDFEFFKPQLEVPFPVPRYSSEFDRQASEPFVTSVVKNVLFDTTAYDNLGIGASVAGVFTPPKGAYLILFTGIFTDSVNELFTCACFFKQNGVQNTLNNSAFVLGATAAVPEVTCPLMGLFVFTGTTTFSVSALITGAAGALSSPVNGSTIVFWVV